MTFIRSIPRLNPVFLIVSVNVVLIAYLVTVWMRPEVPDWKRVQDPHKHGFPSWYGSETIKTSYDPVITGSEELEESLQILLFIDMEIYSPSLPNALYLHELMVNHPDIDVVATSPFTAGWDKDRTISQNLRAAGCRKYLWRIGDNLIDYGAACPNSIVIDQQGSASTVYQEVNRRANITLFGEPQEMLSDDASHEALSQQFGDGWEMGMLAHVLPLVNPAVFKPSIRVPSYREATYYPRPTTIMELWPKMPGRRYSLYKRRVPPEPPVAYMGIKKGENLLNPSSGFSEWWKGYDEHTALSLAHAGICILEDWQAGLLDLRMAEALFAGCIVATVPPDVENMAISDFILPLKPSEEAVPAAQIEAALLDFSDSELMQMALQAHIYARKRFSGPLWLANTIDLISRYNRGARGYMFPHTFRWTCDSNGQRPAWCDN